MFYLSFYFSFLLAAVKAAPLYQLPVASLTGSCTSQTLDDSSVLSLCESERSARLFYQNGTDPSVLLASLSSSEVKIPTSLNMINGYVCSIILHNNKYGQRCYDSAEFVGLSAVLPGAGNNFPSNTFSLTATDSLVVGQPGTCFPGSDRLHFSGLSPQAQLLVVAARNGKIAECDLTEFTPRLFMGALWVGLTLILPALIIIGVTLAFIVGAIPYLLSIGGAAASK